MRDLRVIRICFLLAGIFAAGVVTGRFTAPQPQSLPQPPPVVVQTRGRGHTPATFVAEMGRRVGISTNQQEQIRPIIRQMVREMQPHPPRTQPRLEIFLKTMEKVRPQIETNQMELFDRFVKEQSDMQRRNIERNQQTR